MISKLKDQKAETLIESLVALLIAVLSIALLVSCILTSANINAKVAEKDKKYSKELMIAEGRLEEPGYEKKTIKVDVIFASGASKEIEVTRYGSDDSVFVSYDYATEEEP